VSRHLQLVTTEQAPGLTYEEEMDAIHDAIFALGRLEQCEDVLPDYVRRALVAGHDLLSRFASPTVT
jgi:hypothetical protein